MTYRTPKEAATYNCPIARTFAPDKSSTCDGPDCILWRWKEIRTGNPILVSAIQREMACLAQDEGKGREAKHFQKQATANVSADPEGHGVVPTRGYCGLGSKP